MINKIAPKTRLEILSLYMMYWVDNWGKNRASFDEWFYIFHSHLIPGTVEYAKKRATNCFYCHREFRLNNTYQLYTDCYKIPGEPDRVVIICSECNRRTTNQTANALLNNMVMASLRGKYFWGYHGEKLEFIISQVGKIASDTLHKTGPLVYYCKF